MKLILQESYYPTTTSQLIAGKIGARLVVLPGGTDFDHGQTYEAHIQDVLNKLRGV